MQRAASLIRKLKLPAGSDNPEERAKAAWRLAAGKTIEKHTIAASLVRGTLVVEVGDMIWQRQLHALRYQLLRNMEGILGEQLVTDLDFRPMPPRLKPMREEGSTRRTNGIADPVMSLLYEGTLKKKA